MQITAVTHKENIECTDQRSFAKTHVSREIQVRANEKNKVYRLNDSTSVTQRECDCFVSGARHKMK